MAKKSISLLLTSAIALSGCASHWERAPGNEYADWDTASAECYLMGRGMPKQGFMFAGGGYGRAGAYAAAGAGLASAAMIVAQAAQEQADRDACLTLHGFRKIAGAAK